MAMVRMRLDTARAMLSVFMLNGCTVMLYSAKGRPLEMVNVSASSPRVVVTGPSDWLLSGG